MRRVCFGAAIHRVPFAVPCEPLVKTALELYEACWRQIPTATLHQKGGLPGGWRTIANMMFFKQQLQHARENEYETHLTGFQTLPEFHHLKREMREAATAYLKDHGLSGEEASNLTANAPLFVWSSVHTGGSLHPPHVHSDSMCTGTFYAQRPTLSAPIVFDDPRGRSPFDVLVGIESNLRYGQAANNMLTDLTPPFDQPVVVDPDEGECVLFPPWLVHQVPGTTPDEIVRVSFSFNMLGHWSHTVMPTANSPSFHKA